MAIFIKWLFRLWTKDNRWAFQYYNYLLLLVSLLSQHYDFYIGGWTPPKTQDYLLEGGTLVVQASPTRWVFPSVSVHQLALLWEAVFGFSECFFEDSFSVFAHFMMGDLWAHLPTMCWVFSSFWPKIVWLLYLTLPIHLISPEVTFFVCFPW